MSRIAWSAVQCFMPPTPDLGGGLGGRAHLPPRKNSWGREPPPPPKRTVLWLPAGGQTGNFAPKSGQKWPDFPARAKGARGIPQRAYNSLQIGSNLRKNGSKTQKLLQKCPWWRKSVHIASKTLKTTPKYVKTALRAPKARAKNFSQNLAPPRIFIWGGGGGAPLAGETPTWNTAVWFCACAGFPFNCSPEQGRTYVLPPFTQELRWTYPLFKEHRLGRSAYSWNGSLVEVHVNGTGAFRRSCSLSRNLSDVGLR